MLKNRRGGRPSRGVRRGDKGESSFFPLLTVTQMRGERGGREGGNHLYPSGQRKGVDRDQGEVRRYFVPSDREKEERGPVFFLSAQSSSQQGEKRRKRGFHYFGGKRGRGGPPHWSAITFSSRGRTGEVSNPYSIRPKRGGRGGKCFFRGFLAHEAGG